MNNEQFCLQFPLIVYPKNQISVECPKSFRCYENKKNGLGHPVQCTFHHK